MVARITVVKRRARPRWRSGRHRDRVADPAGEHVAVAKQEEEQVQHDEQGDHELEGILADVERLGRDDLHAAGEEAGEPGLHRLQVGQAEPVQQVYGPTGQRGVELLEPGGDVQLARLDAAIDGRGLLDQRLHHQAHREEHQDHDEEERRGRGHAPALAHADAQVPVERREHDGEHRPPEDRAGIGPQDPDEGQRHAQHDEQEDLVLERLRSCRLDCHGPTMEVSLRRRQGGGHCRASRSPLP